MAKAGRNEPCPCGSGRKYKKCCGRSMGTGGPADIPWDAPPHIKGPTPLGRPQIEAIWRGKRWRAVGSRLYFRPQEETFHEFILHTVLKRVLGKNWYFTELGKPSQEQHQIVRWFCALSEWSKRTATEPNRVRGGWVAHTSGEVQSLAVLAYDVYHLLHTGNLDKRTIRRLKDRRQFQGARYEIAVAAMFARLGYKLEYLSSECVGKHPEFIAVHETTKHRIGVEAKSRHRTGVLHEPGDFDPARAGLADVERLFDDALKQGDESLPFAIFIDVNVPPNEETRLDMSLWMHDFLERMGGLNEPTAAKPDVFNIVVLTNRSYHYRGDQPSAGGEYMSMLSPWPRHPFPHEMLEHIVEAVAEYGYLPDQPY